MHRPGGGVAGEAVMAGANLFRKSGGHEGALIPQYQTFVLSMMVGAV